jgi:hypothetical protein
LEANGGDRSSGRFAFRRLGYTGFGGEAEVVVFDYVAADRRRPLALVVDLGVEADGGYQRVGGDADVFGFLDEVFEGGAERGAALGAKAGGVGVAVNDGMMGDFILAGDGFGTDPAEVVIVDEFAVFVMANRTFAGVSGEVCAAPFLFGIPDLGFLRCD